MPKSARSRTAAAVRKNSAKKTGPLIMFFGLALALLAVLLMPLLTGGAAPAASAAASQQMNSVSVTSLSEAQQLLGFSPEVPSAIPQGYTLTELKVLDGYMMEAVYTNGKTALVYRTAQGKEDLSGDDREYPYMATETGADGVARSFYGVNLEKVNSAVWSDGEYSFSVYTKDTVDAEMMKEFVTSIQ